MVITDKKELEIELMQDLKELSNREQDEIKIYSALFINTCENLEKKKVNLLEKSISNQIKFYGRRIENYSQEIQDILNRYQSLFEKISNIYITWFVAILKDLQNTYDNQKIAITNCKTSIDFMNEVKKEALMYKIDNYEDVIQECKRQLKNCRNDMKNELNETFYNKTNALSVRKPNIFQKILNLFVGKNKVKNFVIDSLNVEINQLEETVNSKVQKIEDEVVNNVAIIEDAIIQTKTIYKDMLEEYGYDR